MRSEERKRHLFVAVDRTSKFAFAQLQEVANVQTAAGFLAASIDAVPYSIIRSSPTMACSSAISLRVGQAQPPAFESTGSIATGTSTGSNIACPSLTSRRPIAKLS